LGAHQYIHIFSGEFMSSGNANKHGGGGGFDWRQRRRLKKVSGVGIRNLGLSNLPPPAHT
jgi:hypothetical protein